MGHVVELSYPLPEAYGSCRMQLSCQDGVFWGLGHILWLRVCEGRWSTVAISHLGLKPIVGLQLAGLSDVPGYSQSPDPLQRNSPKINASKANTELSLDMAHIQSHCSPSSKGNVEPWPCVQEGCRSRVRDTAVAGTGLSLPFPAHHTVIRAGS